MASLHRVSVLGCILFSCIRTSAGDVHDLAEYQVYRGDPYILTCPYDGAVSSRHVFWCKQYEQECRPFSSYTEEDGSVLVDQSYSDRGVRLLTPEGSLDFPEVLLSDEGSYACTIDGGEHTIAVQLQVDVPVTPESVMTEFPGGPVAQNESLSVTCSVEEIKPEPEIYWRIGGVRSSGTITSAVLNEEYGTKKVMNTLSFVPQSSDDGKTVMCIVEQENRMAILKSFEIDIDGTSSPNVVTAESSPIIGSRPPVVSGVSIPVFIIVVASVCVVAAVFVVVAVATWRRKQKGRIGDSLQSKPVTKDFPQSQLSGDADAPHIYEEIPDVIVNAHNDLLELADNAAYLKAPQRDYLELIDEAAPSSVTPEKEGGNGGYYNITAPPRADTYDPIAHSAAELVQHYQQGGAGATQTTESEYMVMS